MDSTHQGQSQSISKTRGVMGRHDKGREMIVWGEPCQSQQHEPWSDHFSLSGIFASTTVEPENEKNRLNSLAVKRRFCRISHG